MIRYVLSQGNQMRNILLPQVLLEHELNLAKLDTGCLHIRFEEDVTLSLGSTK